MDNWILFDWGDTLMRTFDYPGPMCSWPKVEALPDVLATLRAVQGRAGIALATNAMDSQEPEIRKALARVDVDTFVERIFCYRSVGHKKSSPPFFAHVMRQLNVTAEHLCMVGDDFEQDVVAANEVGIKAAWFNARTLEARSGEHFRTIHRLTELPRLLETWRFLAKP